MKPVPFAEYLARQRQPPAVAEELAPVWPPKRKRGADEQKARVSPLLRQSEPQVQIPEARMAGPKLEQSVLKAFEEGRAAARKDLEEERGKLRDGMAEELAKARAEWAADEGERLAQAHRAAFADFERRCAQAVTNILRPFLTQAVIGKVTEALVKNLEVLFDSRTQALFEISGPADLLDALKQKFSDREAAIVYQPDESLDVRVRIEDTVIETQLEAWMRALGALPAEAADE